MLMLGPVQLGCTDNSSRQFYHFMCTEGEADEADPAAAPSTNSTNSTNSTSECCIANSGPVVVGCVPKEEAKFYHLQCPSSGASPQSMAEIANSLILILMIVNMAGMFV